LAVYYLVGGVRALFGKPCVGWWSQMTHIFGWFGTTSKL
jgi:hypothetical protein